MRPEYTLTPLMEISNNQLTSFNVSLVNIFLTLEAKSKILFDSSYRIRVNQKVKRIFIHHLSTYEEQMHLSHFNIALCMTMYFWYHSTSFLIQKESFWLLTKPHCITCLFAHPTCANFMVPQVIMHYVL